jgi:hypothetical protein
MVVRLYCVIYVISHVLVFHEALVTNVLIVVSSRKCFKVKKFFETHAYQILYYAKIVKG